MGFLIWQVNEHDYISLISTQRAYSCTEAERVQPEADNSPAHNAISRLLHRMKPLPENLWQRLGLAEFVSH